MARKKARKDGLDETAIRALAGETVFERGRAVLDLVRRGDTVTARVEGSDTYRVTVQIDAGTVEAYA